MSGVNNVALWTGKKQVHMFPLILSNCSGNKWISPISTVDVTGGIGLDLSKLGKSIDEKEMLFVMKMVMWF
jgi:hypothetical protein